MILHHSKTIRSVISLLCISVLVVNFCCKSRHTIVCRAAQEAGAPHREYIDRKKENAIFTHLYLGDTLSD